MTRLDDNIGVSVFLNIESKGHLVFLTDEQKDYIKLVLNNMFDKSIRVAHNPTYTLKDKE